MEYEYFLLFLFSFAVIALSMILTKQKKKNQFCIEQSQSALKQNKQKYLECPLLYKQYITHDTLLLKFGLPLSNQVLGVNIGEHIIIHEQIQTIENPDGELVERKYTPTSIINQKGSFDLLIKVYKPNVHPSFPNGGKLTSWIENLQINQTIHISGPTGKLQYLGHGQFRIKNDGKFQNKKYSRLVMIAGGSGITPMFQIIQSVILAANDKTRIDLLFGNKTEEDILLYNQLKLLQKNNKSNFQIYFTLDNANDEWQGFRGFITLEMTRLIFGSLDNNTLALSCGPPIMNKLAMQHFIQLGAKEENYFKF